VEVDRQQGLHSIPARFGVPAALWLAKLLHLVTVASLTIAGVLLETGVLYYVGVVAFLLLLVAEHRMVSPRDLSRVGTAFFTMNGIISVVFLAFVAAETLSR
jgi:4-hydroxybenzoate polyprenyltransferase